MRTLLLLSLCALGACTGSSGGTLGVPCNELTLGPCRDRTDCAVDLCFACSCTPSHESCRALAAAPFECPQVECLMPECCDVDTTCAGNGAPCQPPGTPFGCGACNNTPGDCSSDGDCNPLANHHICEPIACSCDGQKQCVPGCAISQETCPGGSACNPASERCEAIACGDGCPPEFECGDLGRCVRKPCTRASDCPDGFCVGGQCFDGQGECRLPVP